MVAKVSVMPALDAGIQGGTLTSLPPLDCRVWPGNDDFLVFGGQG